MIMKKYPNVTIKIVLRCGNRILILKHKNGVYDFPGGRIEFYESLLGALQRELKEELDLVLPGEPQLFHVWNYISKNKRRHSVMIYYIYSINKIPRIVSPEKLQILWLLEKQMMEIIRDYEFVKKLYHWKKL